MKNEVIIQKSHRYGYDHAVRNCGIRFVEVETADELERAVNERTAMMLFFNAADPSGQIKLTEFAQLGKKHNIPTFNDAAADVPPVDNLSKYIKLGYDLVTFSGGKGLRGPQSAGLLLGRKDLIAAARLNGPPFSDSIGRGMKAPAARCGQIQEKSFPQSRVPTTRIEWTIGHPNPPPRL